MAAYNNEQFPTQCINVEFTAGTASLPILAYKIPSSSSIFSLENVYLLGINSYTDGYANTKIYF